MNYLNNLYFKSKPYFFLDILIYLSILSIVARSFLLNFFSLLVVVIFFFYTLKKKILFKFCKKNLILILIFFFVIILNTTFSYAPLESLSRFLNVFKLIFYAICIIYFLKKIEGFEENIARCLIAVFLIITASMIYQYFNGTIFGYGTFTNHGFGLSGVFGKEYIAGGILLKIIFFSLPVITSSKNKKINVFFVILFGLILIFFANQRTPIIMALITFFIYFFLTNIYNFKFKFFIFLFLLTATYLIVYKNPNIHEKFLNKTKEQFSSSKQATFLQKLKDTQWGAHYLTAINIALDHKIIGSGLRTFRFICSEKKYENIDSKQKQIRCSTHPHNLYLEIVSELGLFVFFSFIIAMIYIFIKLVTGIINKTKNSLEYFLGFFVLFFPLQITGSFFSAFNGYFNFLGLAIIIYSINYRRTNEKIN